MGEALRMAVAAGSAALLTEGTGLCWMPDIEKLMGQVRLRPMENSLQAVGG
jgi:fructose-1-phosphate kinase PfkB-like protein